MKPFAYLIYACLLFATVQAVINRNFKGSNLLINGTKLTLSIDEPGVNFFVLGDWGGTGLPIVTKTPAQLTSAHQMRKMATNYNTRFQLGLGDNFYLHGVKSVDDKKFHEIFEEVYKGNELLNTPWFHVLGNHDHYGNAQAQIDYTAKSNRWIMPNYNYTVDVMTSNGKKNLISIVMIDTIKLCGNTFFSMNPFSKDDTSTPHFMSKEDQNLAAMYLVNFENKLKAANSSGVPYIIVGGHFPVYSVAEHGSTQCLVQNVMPLLHKYKVSAYLSGHDHNLQHISYTNLGSTVEYIVAGANSWNANSMQNFNTVPNLSLKFRWPENTELVYGGFLLVEAGQFKMNVNFVKADGTFLYKKEILPRV